MAVALLLTRRLGSEMLVRGCSEQKLLVLQEFSEYNIS